MGDRPFRLRSISPAVDFCPFGTDYLLKLSSLRYAHLPSSAAHLEQRGPEIAIAKRVLISRLLAPTIAIVWEHVSASASLGLRNGGTVSWPRRRRKKFLPLVERVALIFQTDHPWHVETGFCGRPSIPTVDREVNEQGSIISERRQKVW